MKMKREPTKKITTKATTYFLLYFSILCYSTCCLVCLPFSSVFVSIEKGGFWLFNLVEYLQFVYKFTFDSNKKCFKDFLQSRKKRIIKEINNKKNVSRLTRFIRKLKRIVAIFRVKVHELLGKVKDTFV